MINNNYNSFSIENNLEVPVELRSVGILDNFNHFWKIIRFSILEFKLSSARQIFSRIFSEVHCGDTKRNPKFQVNTFIHYQDMEFLNFSVFLTVRLYFPTNCFQILTALGLESDKLRTVGIFSISQLDLYTKEEFLFLTVF